MKMLYLVESLLDIVVVGNDLFGGLLNVKGGVS